jgi:hypothetical protein
MRAFTLCASDLYRSLPPTTGFRTRRGSAKMRLEAPKIVEMLARPQQGESRANLALVATGNSLVRTLEQAPAAFGIANVRRRSRRCVDDGISERHEPRAQRVNFGVKVRATLREARVAIGLPTEIGERLSGALDARRACDQRANALHVRASRGALGEVLAKGVVEAVDGGGCASYVIALREGSAVDWPPAWLAVRAMGAGWLILAVWASFGLLLAAVSRGTSLAIGVGILYALVIEGLISAFAGAVSFLEPVTEFFLRANAYSLVKGLGLSVSEAAGNGPGAFSGPYVSTGQALLVLVAYMAAFLTLSGFLLRRRDVT